MAGGKMNGRVTRLLITPLLRALEQVVGPHGPHDYLRYLDGFRYPLAGEFSFRREVIPDIRRRQTAFHPNATQFTLHLGDAIFAYWRQSADRRRNIFCFHNVSKEPQRVPLNSVNLSATDDWSDLISGEEIDRVNAFLDFAPYQCIWLANKRKFLPY